jgi:hypothetical protein
MDRNLVGRVTKGSALALLLIAAAALFLADLRGFLGVLAGGGLALGSFWWLHTGSRRGLRLFSAGRVHPLWLLGLGVRHLSLFGALGLLLWTGSVHPLWLIVGLSVLPPVLVVQALRTVPREA